MENVDYSNYSFQELLEVRANINKERYPENYRALEAELAARGNSVESIRKEEDRIEQETLSIAEHRVKIIGYFQLAAALVITVLLLVGLSQAEEINLFVIIVGPIVVGLNLAAGYTAIKELYQWYWLSIFNQLLQVFSFSIASYIVKYSGLGGLYMEIYWGDDFGLNFSASFDPGFQFYQLFSELPRNSITVDFLAIVFAMALVTVQDLKRRPTS